MGNENVLRIGDAETFQQHLGRKELANKLSNLNLFKLYRGYKCRTLSFGSVWFPAEQSHKQDQNPI